MTVVPRSGETAIAALGRVALGADAETEVVDATDDGAVTRGAAASTSSLRMRPPTPVPLTRERSTPLSAASLRTIGVT